LLLGGEVHTGADLQARDRSVRASEDALAAGLQLGGAYAALATPQVLSLQGWSVQQTVDLLAAVPAWFEQDDSRARSEALELDSDVVHLELDEQGVVQVHMQDVAANNMLTDALVAGLESAFAQINQNPACRTVVLTGQGNYFCSGGTQETLLAIHEGREQFTDRKVFQLAMDCDVPVIAALQGHGIGAGLVLGLFADVALLSEESQYLSPYMDYGFTPGAGATHVLPSALGVDLGREGLFSGQSLSGSQMKQRGLLQRVLPRSSVLAAAVSLARRVASHPRELLVALKKQWTTSQVVVRDAAYEAELKMHAQTFV
ncbi:polyketide synthase, partial [Marinicella sediminis]